MPEPTPRPSFRVEIETGLHPMWTADRAADAMLLQIDRMEKLVGHPLVAARVTSVRAISGQSAGADIDGPYELPVVWVVSGDGTFVDAGPAGSFYGTSGYFVFDDEGSVLSEGFVTPYESSQPS
jgi:hypothetical protein